MKFLAEIAVEICRHVFSEHGDQTEIVAIAVADTGITGVVGVEAFAGRCYRIKSSGPHIPQWLTVI